MNNNKIVEHLCITNNAKNCVKVGRYLKEKIRNHIEYEILDLYNSGGLDWRKFLCNTSIAPFEIEYSQNNIIKYNTIQHMIEATKINLSDPNKAYEYTLNSGTILSQENGIRISDINNMSNFNEKINLDWKLIESKIIFIAMLERFR